MNVVNFYIIPKLSRYDIVDFVSEKSENKTEDIEKLHSCWRKEGALLVRTMVDGQNFISSRMW